MLVGQEEILYQKPFVKISEVFHRSLLTKIVFDCEYDHESMTLNQYTLEQQYLSSFGRHAPNEFSTIPLLELTRLARLEAWITNADTKLQSSLTLNWTAAVSLTADFTTDHLPVDLYDVKVARLASSAKLLFAAEFQVPYLTKLQEMTPSEFSCEKGAYLLIGMRGKYPETAAAFHPISLPIQFLCESGNSMFDLTNLKITTKFNDDCDATKDHAFRDEQCTSYRSVDSVNLERGLNFEATFNLRQISSRQSDVLFNDETLTIKANLAESGSRYSTSTGLQLVGQNLKFNGKFNSYINFGWVYEFI